MKCILLLTFVALCYSYPYRYGNNYGGGRNVNINEDGTIVITGGDGKRITITKSAGVTGKRIDITVTGPNIPTKRIHIDEQKELRDVNLLDENSGSQEGFSDEDSPRDKRSSKNNRRRSSQGDTLTEILREYQGGVVDNQMYQQLLRKVNSAVQMGQLSGSIYEVLQNLDQGAVGQNQGIWTPQQEDMLRQQIQKQGVGSYLQKPYNVMDLLRRQVVQQQLQELWQQQQQQQQGYQPQGSIQQQQYGRGSYYGVPVTSTLSQQPILSSYGQTILNPYETAEDTIIGTSAQGIVSEVPTVGGKQEIIEGVLLEDPEVVTYQNGQGFSYRIGGAPGISWYDLLNNIYGTQGLQQRGGSLGQYGHGVGQYGQRVGQYGNPIWQYGQQVGQYGQQSGQIGQRISAGLSEIIEDERDILGQQRQIQQQQLQQEQQQQQLLQQSLQQQRQQQQQQNVQQQVLQQVQQQEQQQQQLQQQLQRQQNNIWKQYLLSGGSTQGGAQQGGLLQQQLGVYPPGGLYGGYVQQGQGQGVPIIQRYNVPLVL